MINQIVKLNDAQKESLVKSISSELKKRCFFAKIELLDVKDRKGNDCLDLTSEVFYTVPNLHGDCQISDFGGTIDYDTPNESNQEYKVINVFIRVHVAYQGNCTGIFSYSGYFTPLSYTPGEYRGEITIKEVY